MIHIIFLIITSIGNFPSSWQRISNAFRRSISIITKQLFSSLSFQQVKSLLPSIRIRFLMKIPMIGMIWCEGIQWISWLFVKLFSWTIWKSSVVKIRRISIRWIDMSLLRMISTMMTTRGIMSSEKCEIPLITTSRYHGCHWIYQWRLKKTDNQVTRALVLLWYVQTFLNPKVLRAKKGMYNMGFIVSDLLNTIYISYSCNRCLALSVRQLVSKSGQPFG